MPTIDLNSTFGSFFIAVVVSSALFGVTCSQVFHYFQNYSSDGLFVKGVVVMLLICEALHSALAIHATYYYVILNYANPLALVNAIWSATLTIAISAVIILVVHIFYARRVYYMSGKNIVLAAIIAVIALVHFGTAVAVAGRAFQLPPFKPFVLENAGLLVASLVLGGSVDIIIAASLSYYLQKGRSGIGSTDTLINRLMVIAINNGVLTSALDVVIIAFVAQDSRHPNNLYYLAIYQVVGNLYTNSMMATLNSRQSLRKTARDVASFPAQSLASFRIASRTAVGMDDLDNMGEPKTMPVQVRTAKHVDVV